MKILNKDRNWYFKGVWENGISDIMPKVYSNYIDHRYSSVVSDNFYYIIHLEREFGFLRNTYPVKL